MRPLPRRTARRAGGNVTVAFPDIPRRVRAPIILLGSGRSGTTLLGQIVSLHPDVAYWLEPRPVWMYRHAYRPHHELRAADLTPAIARSIDRRFARYLARRGRSRFAEKTPSNCLRIPFLHALYPDCRIINIIRDGREVVASTLRVRAGKLRARRMWVRLFETPPWEWPAYVPLFFQTLWRTRVLRRPSLYWGVKPSGWKRWLDLPPHLIAANQWRAVVAASIRDGRALPAGNYREVSFERLVREPESVVGEILEFAGLRPASEVIEFVRSSVDASSARPRAREDLGPRRFGEVEEAIGPLLEELGYGAPTTARSMP